MSRTTFLLAVITSPEHWSGEADCLESMLEAGLEKLHIRKPGKGPEILLDRLASRWSDRLVLHGGRDALHTAALYGIPQVHGHWHKPWNGKDPDQALKGAPDRSGVALSASVHSWQEVWEVPKGGLEYVFLSPVFDSISKPGYLANNGLLRRPAGEAPCPVVGLGGIDDGSIGQVMENGWDGAALLGYIWEKPKEAVDRWLLLKKIVEQHGR